jgi:hypothetical protein
MSGQPFAFTELTNRTANWAANGIETVGLRWMGSTVKLEASTTDPHRWPDERDPSQCSSLANTGRIAKWL